MKALEFHGDGEIPHRHPQATPRITSAPRPNPPSQSRSIASAKESTIDPGNNPVANPPPHIDEATHVCGVKLRPGHSIHRHRARNTAVWQKIKNWD